MRHLYSWHKLTNFVPRAASVIYINSYLLPKNVEAVTVL